MAEEDKDLLDVFDEESDDDGEQPVTGTPPSPTAAAQTLPAPAEAKLTIQQLAERKRKQMDEKREAEEQKNGQKRLKQMQTGDSDVEEDADAELSGPLPPTERQRQALAASLGAPERMPILENSDEEDLLENETDRDFIDDDGAEPAEDAPYYSDGEQARLEQADQAEEEEQDELEAMFKPKRKGRPERAHGEKKATVENFLARMEVAAEHDHQANLAKRPAVNKLKMLPEFEQIMAQRDLHEEFLDGGVLGVFKAWIEPMQDGSLPNLKIRTAVLRALLGINFFFEDRKEQLKKSRLGNVVMFLYKLPDETAANRRMAKELVERWSRPIFEQYRDTREEERDIERREEAAMEARRHADISRAAVNDSAQKSALRPTDKGFRFHAALPQGARLDYKKQPTSKITLDMNTPAGGRAKPKNRGLLKKLDDVTKRGKQTGRAAKVSVEGRGLIINTQ